MDAIAGIVLTGLFIYVIAFWRPRTLWLYRAAWVAREGIVVAFGLVIYLGKATMFEISPWVGGFMLAGLAWHYLVVGARWLAGDGDEEDDEPQVEWVS